MNTLLEQADENIVIVRAWDDEPVIAGATRPNAHSWAELRGELGDQVRRAFGTADSTIIAYLTETVTYADGATGRDYSTWAMLSCGSHSVEFDGTARNNCVFQAKRWLNERAPI